MALYVLSDTHLSLSTGKPMDVFGARWKDHAERIAFFMKRDLTNDDVTVIPGDVSWGMDLKEARDDLRFLDALPGKKILGKGNHDYWWSTQTKINAFFEKENLKTLSLLFNNAYSVGNIAVCGTRGWYFDAASPAGTDRDKIVAREAGRLRRSLEAGRAFNAAESVVFMHFPPVFGDFECRELTGVLKEFGVKRCYYGHLHAQYDVPRAFTHDGVSYRIASSDYLQFMPLKVSEE
ncbi:MAG: metallophosphoesterase [Clostridia bacterium]|nr:metallophosphoesterase [Clostridia bacterium]